MATANDTPTQSKKDSLFKRVEPYLKTETMMWFVLPVVALGLDIAAAVCAPKFIRLWLPNVSVLKDVSWGGIVFFFATLLPSTLPQLQHIPVMFAGDLWGLSVKSICSVFFGSVAGELLFFEAMSYTYTEKFTKTEKTSLAYASFCKFVRRERYLVPFLARVSGTPLATLVLGTLVPRTGFYPFIALQLPIQIVFLYIGTLFNSGSSRRLAIDFYTIVAARFALTIGLALYTYIQCRRIRPEVKAERAAEEAKAAEEANAAQEGKTAEEQATILAVAEPKIDTAVDNRPTADLEIGSGQQ